MLIKSHEQLRQSRQLQNNRPCPLECLPTELRVKIMEFTGDYHSLWSLISASPHYLNAFLGFRKPLLTMITIRELTARNVILCNQKTVSNPRDTPVGVQAKNIEWLDYKFKKGVEHTLTLQSNLHAALQTYYSQIESNSTLSLDVQQLKALRALEDVVTWLRFDSDLQRFYDQVSPPSDFEAADSLCVLMRESTFGSYRNVNNMDYLHDYHIWIKGHRTESEIWPARIAGVWWTCKPSKFPTQLDRLKAFQKYFPWCDIRTVPELRDYEARIWELTPSLCFLFENFEVIQLLRFTRNERP